jgi:hypothetical protein
MRWLGLMGSLIGIILATMVAHANLKATSVVYAWDEALNKFQNSNVWWT